MDRTKNKILIVDDHKVMRDEISALLSGEESLTFCPPASNYHEALETIKTCRPDIVLVDLSLKSGPSGLELIKEIEKRRPFCRCVAISALPAEDLAEYCRKHAVGHYISKLDLVDRLTDLVNFLVENTVEKTKKSP